VPSKTTVLHSIFFMGAERHVPVSINRKGMSLSNAGLETEPHANTRLLQRVLAWLDPGLRFIYSSKT
jgi:hypothetical protein